jgi:hypothetical protein
LRIEITHARGFIGQEVHVVVVCETEVSLSTVTTTLDGAELESFAAPIGLQQYERDFSQVGSASPGQEHTAQVDTIDTEGKQVSAVARWTDV